MNPVNLNIATAPTTQSNSPVITPMAPIAPVLSPVLSPVMQPVMQPVISPVISLAPENPRSSELLATNSHSIPALSSHTAIEISPQTPRLHNAEMLDSKNSSASSELSFKAIPKEFFPLIARFCGDQFQSLNSIWMSSRDNKSIDNRIPKSMLMTMVSLNAMVLSTLPMGMRDLNICKAALKQNGLAWPHIPRKFREEAHTSLGADLAMLAVKSNGLALGK